MLKTGTLLFDCYTLALHSLPKKRNEILSDFHYTGQQEWEAEGASHCGFVLSLWRYHIPKCLLTNLPGDLQISICILRIWLVRKVKGIRITSPVAYSMSFQFVIQNIQNGEPLETRELKYPLYLEKHPWLNAHFCSCAMQIHPTVNLDLQTPSTKFTEFVMSNSMCPLQPQILQIRRDSSRLLYWSARLDRK